MILDEDMRKTEAAPCRAVESCPLGVFTNGNLHVHLRSRGGAYSDITALIKYVDFLYFCLWVCLTGLASSDRLG